MTGHLQTIGADIKRITMQTMRTFGKWLVDLVDGSNNPFDPNDLGHGFKAKELINGRWVIVKDGKFCSLNTPGTLHGPESWTWGTSVCTGSRSEIEAKVNDIKSAFGVFKS